MNKRLFVALTVIIVAFASALQAQICHKYRIVPDTVPGNTNNTFYVQEILGPGQPPGLWVCNWIDFENNGTQNCTNSTSCSYTYTSGGLQTVSYEIHEPFLGNTEVCTSFIYVDACNAAVVAKANNTPDSLHICSGSFFNLTATFAEPLTCSGNWEYAWFNGTAYYDGTGFSSFTETWGTAFQTINNMSLSANKTYKVKTRCSSNNSCTDSSSVFIGIKQNVQLPVFATGLSADRCKGIDTLNFTATALNADSVIYTIDTGSANAGIVINNTTGTVIFNALFTGNSFITATAYGCSGPLSSTYQITTHQEPTINITIPDTSYMCFGDTLFVSSFLSGTLPFSLNYLKNTIPFFISGGMLDFHHIINDSLTHLHFYAFSDANCTLQLDMDKYVLASPVPVFSALEDTTICADAGILLDLGTNNYSYLWSHDNSTAGSAYIDTSLASINMGVNTIGVLITNIHCAVSETANITFSLCTNLENQENKSADFVLYPNPSGGNFVLEFISNPDISGVLTVFDLLGRIYFEKEISTSSFAFSIDNAGNYLLRFTPSEGLPVIKKLTVLKP